MGLRSSLFLAACVVAGGAVAEVDASRLTALQGHDRVEWSTGGGLFRGGSVTMVYDTDEVFARHVASAEAAEETLVAYPPGTFDQAEPVICPDYGIDRVVIMTVGREVAVSRGCPVNEMIELLDALSGDFAEARVVE